MTIQFKTCSLCKQRRQATAMNFYERLERPGEFDSWCIWCKRRRSAPKAHLPIVLSGEVEHMTRRWS
jgi:hypothetical protein